MPGHYAEAMKHTQTWTDIYGSACASFEGRAGGHTWLVAAPPELARSVPAALEGLDGKGSVHLLVHEGVTPLLSALRELRPKGVLVVAHETLASGPGLSLPERQVYPEDGSEYTEGGEFPGWHAALGEGGKVAEHAAASAAALLGVPVMVSEVGSVQQTMERWLDATPHGR